MKILFLSFFIVISDQITKLLVKGISIPSLGIAIEGWQLGSSRSVIGDVVRWTFVENPGMAFGIDVGGKPFFSVFSIFASIGIMLYLYMARNEHLAFRIALSLILGGAIGNLIDRVFYGVIFNEAPLFYGKVVDFIDVDFFNINIFGYHMSRWPVFNIADASVTCGVLLMLFARPRTPATEGKQTEAVATPVDASEMAAASTPSSQTTPVNKSPQS